MAKKPHDPPLVPKPPQRIEGVHAGDFHENRSEVEEAFDKAKDLWSKYGNYVMIALIVVLGVWAALRLYNYIHLTRANDASSALMSAGTSPEANDVVAGDHDSIEGVAQLASLRAADLYLQRSQQPVAADLSAEEKAQALDKAGTRYQQVLDNAEHPLFQMNALLGLAAVAEENQQWDAARGHYSQATQLAEANYFPSIAAKAKARSALLDQIRKPIPFGNPRAADAASSPSPAMTPATAPATSPASTAPAS